jgi:hypothetical protein
MKGTRLRQEHVQILEDDQYSDDDNDTQMDESRGPMEESRATLSESEDEEEEEEEEVEESVQEDMARFKETFKGIDKRYRLINRIGEGMSLPPYCWLSQIAYSLPVQEPFPQYTRLKISTTTHTRTNGTLKRKRNQNGVLRPAGT